ncbi:MAG: acyl-CoA thioesterase [Pseudomonadales bacterium]
MSRSLREKHWPTHPALSASICLYVPFQDADPTGVAWHGNYFRYYDAARVELLQRLEFGYRDMSALGQIWPIVDTRARYLRAIPFGSKIEVQVQLVEWEFRLRMFYQITDEQGTLMNEAYTLQVPVDAKTDRLIIGAPESLQARVAELLAS